MNLKVRLNIRRDIGEILFVISWKDDGVYPGPVRGQQLFLNTANRQNLSTKRNLPGHGNVTMHWNSGKRAHQGRGHRHSRGWTILGDGAFRHVDVQVQMFMEIFGYSEQMG